MEKGNKRLDEQMKLKTGKMGKYNEIKGKHKCAERNKHKDQQEEQKNKRKRRRKKEEKKIRRVKRN